jgi:hypothetical protein
LYCPNIQCRKYIEVRLPEEYEKCMVGLTAILREAWTTSQQTQDKRERIQALSLAKESHSMKLDLLTNATLVDDTIRFVSSNKYKQELNHLQVIAMKMMRKKNQTSLTMMKCLIK